MADPDPEPPYRTYTASGSWGQTISLQGMTVTVDRMDPIAGPFTCATDDPERAAWTEIVSVRLTMTWKDPSDADWPELIAGKASYGVTWWDADSIRSGEPVLLSTCKRPADPDRVVISFAYRDAMDQYRWTIQ